jgi:hypothetical protein
MLLDPDDYGMESCIFFEVNFLWSSGRTLLIDFYDYMHFLKNIDEILKINSWLFLRNFAGTGCPSTKVPL